MTLVDKILFEFEKKELLSTDKDNSKHVYDFIKKPDKQGNIKLLDI